MAEFTNKDLKSARESRNMPRWKLANEVGASEDTVRRWETGDTQPGPDDVGNIERALGCPGLWHKWMMSNYDSYRERHGDVSEVGHLAADVLRMRHEIQDVLPLLGEIVASIQQTLGKMPDGE